jgi:hypothetical protein
MSSDDWRFLPHERPATAAGLPGMIAMLPDDASGLFLSQIPVPPGDPGALSAAAATYTSAHGEIDRSRAALANAAAQVGGVSWTGLGASAYRQVTGELAAVYGLTATALADGATALRRYATALATAKQTAHQANSAVSESNAAAQAMLAAQDAAGQAQDAADSATQTAATAQAQAAASPHSPSAVLAADNARSAASDAQSAAAAAANRLSALTGEYEAANARALSLLSEAQTQATVASAAAAAGFDAAADLLAGVKPKAARGGAHGVTGENPFAKVIDEMHASLGAAGVDGGLWLLGKGAEQAEKFMQDLPEMELQWLHGSLPWGKGLPQEDWDAALHGWWMKSDAAEAFGEDFVNSTKWLGLASRFGRVAGGPIAVAGDVLMIMNPTQAGTMGDVDRGVAAVNGVVVGADAVGAAGALLGVDALSFSIPPVGVAVAVGTGLYLAGAYAYKHWTWFRQDLAKPIGHAVAHLADDVGHDISDAASTISSWF